MTPETKPLPDGDIYDGHLVWRHRLTEREVVPTPAAPYPTKNRHLWELIEKKP